MKEYKVYVKDKETSRKVQEHAFELGYKWASSKTNIANENEKFLHFNSHGYGFLKCCFGYNDYKRLDNKELTPEEFLRLSKEDVEEREFNIEPLDAVTLNK